MDDDLVARYAAEAKAAMEAEAARRVEESTDPQEEERLRNLSLAGVVNTEHFVPCSPVSALFERHSTGTVAASPYLNAPQKTKDLIWYWT